MKKVICLIVSALLIALTVMPSAVASAQFVPSKTTGDMTQIEIKMEDADTSEKNVFFTPILADEKENEKTIAISHAQIEKLKESTSVEKYFGEVKDSEGNVVSLTELLETEELNCFEFCPVKAGGFEQQEGVATLKMYFVTPYSAGEKILVLIGFFPEEDGQSAADENKIEWFVYEAEVDEKGWVVTSIDVQTLLRVQENNALMAIVSK